LKKTTKPLKIEGNHLFAWIYDCLKATIDTEYKGIANLHAIGIRLFIAQILCFKPKNPSALTRSYKKFK
jgi:hypothetical protein